jgi:hypothetical protein
MRILVVLVVSLLILSGCSDQSQPPGKKPSLTQGADEFMKTYGAAESGVTEDKPAPTTEKKAPEETKAAPEEKK